MNFVQRIGLTSMLFSIFLSAVGAPLQPGSLLFVFLAGGVIFVLTDD